MHPQSGAALLQGREGTLQRQGHVLSFKLQSEMLTATATVLLLPQLQLIQQPMPELKVKARLVLSAAAAAVAVQHVGSSPAAACCSSFQSRCVFNTQLRATSSHSVSMRSWMSALILQLARSTCTYLWRLAWQPPIAIATHECIAAGRCQCYFHDRLHSRQLKHHGDPARGPGDLLDEPMNLK